MKKDLIAIYLFYLLFISKLFASGDLPDGYKYVFPQPNSKFIHPTSTIIVRFENISPFELINLSKMLEVIGGESGYHSGKTYIASDDRTVIFDSSNDYELGETVKVKIEPRFNNLYKIDVKSLNYEFKVLSKKVSPTDHQKDISAGSNMYKSKLTNSLSKIMSNGVSVPSDFPHVVISQNNNPSDEYIFLNNWGPPNYNIIFNTSGDPVWYLRTPDTRRDFKVQSNGWITMLVRGGFGGSSQGYIAFDENFEFIKSMRTTNGYSTDEHELFMLPDSGYFLIGRRETKVDMSQYVIGGKTDATVRETCIQEFTSDDNLIFIWRAWDHFDIRDLELESLTDSYIRFPHMNSIFIDEDGHILLSSRHLSEFSKIHRQSGEFIWRMCGVPQSPNNDFQFVNDPLNGFRNQHTISSLGNNRYLLFDNGNMHGPAVTRTVEYEIDTVSMTANLVWEFRNDENPLYSYSWAMGNAQRLQNGNTHINYGIGGWNPTAQEVTPSGEKKFEMRFETPYFCYRSFRHPWNGIVKTPYLLVEAPQDTLTLLFNKFGDENIDYFNIYGDTFANPITIIDTSRNTLKQIINLNKGSIYYFRVTAVSNTGIESNYSNEETFFINESIVTLATNESESPLSERFELYSNFPNPFNPITYVRYNLPVSSEVSIIVYNMDGQEIIKLQQADVMEAGVHAIKFDGSNLASGIYFYKLTTKSLLGTQYFTETKKMMLIK